MRVSPRASTRPFRGWGTCSPWLSSGWSSRWSSTAGSTRRRPTRSRRLRRRRRFATPRSKAFEQACSSQPASRSRAPRSAPSATPPPGAPTRPPRRPAHPQRLQSKAEPGGTLAAARDGFGTRLAEAVQDGEPVALGVVDALLRKAQPPTDEQLEVVLRIRNRVHERVVEDAHDVAHADALRQPGPPGGIAAGREGEQRIVGRTAVEARDERRELRRDATVHFD